MKTVSTPLSLILLLFLLSSFTKQPEILETMVQGKIVDVNNSAIKTKIIIYRNGQSWFAESDAKGNFSISLPNDKAYAIKIYNENYKNHVSAIYLKANTPNLSHTINLIPR